MNVFTKQKETLRLQKPTYGDQMERLAGGKVKLNVSAWIHTHSICLK